MEYLNKNIFSRFLGAFLLIVLLSSCKSDDDKPETTNFTQYFDCKINNEVFESTGIPFSCSPLAWDYYPEQYLSTPAGYAVLWGQKCESFEMTGIRIWGLQHQTGTLNFLEPQFADSVSPYFSYIDTTQGNFVVIENLIAGQMTIEKFTPRESGSSPLGEIQGTFEFTITDSLGMDTLRITDGRFLSTVSIAQPPPNLSMSEHTSAPLSTGMDYLMAPLDFTEVTSGILLDKGFPMMEIAAFDGTANGDTLKEYGDWFRQFGTMVTSKTTVASPVGITDDYKPAADTMLKTGVIPIMVLHAAYHKFISDSTALSSLITFQNNQLNDVARRTSSPEETLNFFSTAN